MNEKIVVSQHKFWNLVSIAISVSLAWKSFESFLKDLFAYRRERVFNLLNPAKRFGSKSWRKLSLLVFASSSDYFLITCEWDKTLRKVFPPGRDEWDREKGLKGCHKRREILFWTLRWREKRDIRKPGRKHTDISPAFSLSFCYWLFSNLMLDLSKVHSNGATAFAVLSFLRYSSFSHAIFFTNVEFTGIFPRKDRYSFPPNNIDL